MPDCFVERALPTGVLKGIEQQVWLITGPKFEFGPRFGPGARRRQLRFQSAEEIQHTSAAIEVGCAWKLKIRREVNLVPLQAVRFKRCCASRRGHAAPKGPLRGCNRWAIRILARGRPQALARLRPIDSPEIGFLAPRCRELPQASGRHEQARECHTVPP
jgi:hypothetical protein